MEILFLLVPLSAVLMLIILGVFAWAVHGGQFEDVEQEGQRILSESEAVDDDQAEAGGGREK
jgi:cbb3-type cytochrome oxidase maturation protein